MLQVNQIVRYERTLWKVTFVNDCRAHIVPLHHDASRGVNISPNSVLEIVSDLAHAELIEAEAEIQRLKLALAQRAADERALAEAEEELAALRKEVGS